MKRAAFIGILVFSALWFVGVSLAEEQAAAPQSQTAHPATTGKATLATKATMGSKATMWQSSDLKWEPMSGVEGVRVARLWGDMKNGGYGALVKLPANSKHPLHIHTNAIKAVVVFGEFVYRPEGGSEEVLGPGSYLMIPGGLRHSSGTRSAGCELFQEQAGRWDLIPLVAPATAAKHKKAAAHKTVAAAHKKAAHASGKVAAAHNTTAAGSKTMAANHR
jgi:hypothetical protein